MSDARGNGSADEPVERPIENSYVVPDTRLVAGEYPGAPPSKPKPELEQRLGTFLDAGITAFIDLTAPKDSLAPYESTLRALAQQRGIDLQYESFAITDMDTCEEQFMCSVLDAIDEHLAAKRTVYVHCWGGVGRTGTVVGCWLVRHGKMGQEALAEVSRLFATMSKDKVKRHAARGSPQTPAQREMIEEWCESVMVRRSSAKTTESRRRRKERGTPPSARAKRKEPPISELEDDVEEETAEDILRQFAVEHRPARVASARAIHTRIRGCLLGGALGDALGWPVEFLSLSAIRRTYGAAGIREPAVNKVGVSEITDDTQMTLFTAEGILRSTTRNMEQTAYREPDGTNWEGSHCAHPAVMQRAYVRWLATQDGEFEGRKGPLQRMPFGDPGWLIGVEGLYMRRSPGNTCVSALQARDVGEVASAQNDSKGCGGVMRVAPIGLVPCDDPFGYAAMAAALTHGHSTGYLSAGAYAQIISELLFEEYDGVPRVSLRDAVESVFPRLQKEPGHEETLSALEGALEMAARPGEPSAERVEELGAGWIAEEALAIGVYCAIVGDDFEHCVRLAVNHSGDSDSTGSIAGALFGVQYGKYGLPREWLARLELREVISGIGDDLLVGYGGGEAWRERYPGV